MQRILVIDDEYPLCTTLAKILREEGYEVLTSQSAKKGLEILNSEKLDLVLLDINMPEMDGIEMLERIRQIDKNLPVIMITGYGALKTAKESMKLGAYDYITKPFDLNFLKLVVKNALSEE